MRTLLTVVMLLAVAAPAVNAAEVAMPLETFLTAQPWERLGYAKGVIDAFGGRCHGKTWEQLMGGTDLMIQRARLRGGAFVTSRDSGEMPAGVYVMVSARALGCSFPPQGVRDINATIDEFAGALNQGR